MAQTSEKTKLLYEVILEELKSMNDIEIRYAKNSRTGLCRNLVSPFLQLGIADTRYMGEVDIKYKMKEQEETRSFLKFFKRVYKTMVPETNLREVKKRLAENPAIGFPYDDKIFSSLHYERYLGLTKIVMTMDMRDFDGKNSFKNYSRSVPVYDRVAVREIL